MKYKIFVLVLLFLFAVSCSKLTQKSEQEKREAQKTAVVSENEAQESQLEEQKEELEEKQEELKEKEEELRKRELEIEEQKRAAKLQMEMEKLKAEKARLEAEKKRLERERAALGKERRAKEVEKKKEKEKIAVKTRKIVIPEGTELVVSLMERLSTAENEVGDRFRGVLDKSIKLKNGYKIPVKTKVEGKVVECEPSGKVSGRAKMTLRLTRIKIRGKWYEIRTNKIRMVAKKTTKKDAAIIGGSSALGAIIGGIVGGKKGAGIGALIAGGTGTAVVLNTKGKEIELPVETEFKFELRDDLVIQK